MQLRCFCSKAPLLGLVQADAAGHAFVHIKIFKQSRVFGEVIVESGTVRLRCRECGRWHTVKVQKVVDFNPEDLPQHIRI